MSSNWQPQIPVKEIKAGPIEGGPDGVKGSENEPHGGARKRIVVVGLGMVGISFMWVSRCQFLFADWDGNGFRLGLGR
jgi:nitrite reductase (NAD(P)H)